MSWQDLHEGILEEFTEAGRLSTDLAFSVMSGMVTIKEQLRKRDCATYRGKKRLDPAWRAKESRRNAKYNARRPTTRAGRAAK